MLVRHRGQNPGGSLVKSLGERSGGLTLGLPQTGRQEATVDPLSEVGEQRDHPLTFPLVAASDVIHHVVTRKGAGTRRRFSLGKLQNYFLLQKTKITHARARCAYN